MSNLLKKIKAQLETRLETEKISWQQFQGKGNSNKTLIKKAKTITPFIITLAGKDTKSLFELLEKAKDLKINHNKFDEIFIEIVLFYLHFIDRTAFQYLGNERRNIFIDILFLEIRELLSHTYNNSINVVQFRSIFSKLYSERQIEYGKYEKMFAEKSKGTKDTLFWEFGKKIAKISENEMDIMVIMYIYTVVSCSFTILQLPELLKE